MWEYRNGNVDVKIDDDGTRSLTCYDVPSFEFPIHIDISLTANCNCRCPHCHTGAFSYGSHGSIDELYEILDELPGGIELSLICGDILSLGEDLTEFLEWCKDKEFLPSVHISFASYITNKHLVHYYIDHRLIYGIRIGMPEKLPAEYAEQLKDIKSYPHMAINTIAGIHSMQLLENLLDSGFKKIVLQGFRVTEYSKDYLEANQVKFDKNLLDLKRHLYKLLCKGVILLDDSASRILQVERFFTEEGLRKLMGVVTTVPSVFIDLVNRLFWPDNLKTGQEKSLEEISLINYFQTIKTTI